MIDMHPNPGSLGAVTLAERETKLPENAQGEGDDTVWVRRCQNGEVEAFAVLVERHQQKMFNIAYRMLGDYGDAGDVVQESFLRAYRSIDRFRGEARFSTWLTRIVINQAHNRLKHTTTRARREVSSDPIALVDIGGVSGTPSAEDALIERLDKEASDRRIQECLDALDEEQRTVLVLRDIQGFSYEEIGATLELPDGTVKSRLFRARNTLKGMLLKVLGEGQ